MYLIKNVTFLVVNSMRDFSEQSIKSVTKIIISGLFLYLIDELKKKKLLVKILLLFRQNVMLGY